MEPSKASSSTAKREDEDDLRLDKSPGDIETPVDKLFTEDSQILMNLIPEEIWLQVFSDNFKGTTEEFLYMINSSPVFRSLFSSQRTFYLFQNIFPFLQPYLHSYSDSGTRKRGTTLLTLRTICSSWSRTVDSFIHRKSTQNFIRSTPESFLELDAIQSSSFHEFPSNRLSKVTAFLNHFSASHPPPLTSIRNPFIGTTLNIPIIQGTADLYPFFVPMLHLLQLHGWHILQSRITIDLGPAFFWPAILYVLHWLSSMSQLERLHLSIREFQLAPPEFFIRHFQQLIEERLVPNLCHLKVLRLDAMAIPIYRNLAQKNAEFIKTLLLVHLDTPLDFKILRIPFPNLECLEMGLGTKRGVINLVEAKRGFCGQPKLKVFVLSCSPIKAFVQWSTVFKGLQMQSRWGGQLEKVVLRLPIAKKEENKKKILEDSKKKRIGLWKVTRLEMEVWNRCHLDFLLPLKSSLEELRITNHLVYSCWECDEEVKIGKDGPEYPRVQFLGWENDMERSNIWAIFGKLEKLVIWRNGKEKTWYRSDLPSK